MNLENENGGMNPNDPNKADCNDTCGTGGTQFSGQHDASRSDASRSDASRSDAGRSDAGRSGANANSGADKRWNKPDEETVDADGQDRSIGMKGREGNSTTQGNRGGLQNGGGGIGGQVGAPDLG